MFFICDFWLIYTVITPLTHRERETQACGLKLNDRGSFLLETVNLISQHSSRNRKSNSARAALSISCLAAQVDKCTAELINSAYILDALMLFFSFLCFLSQLPCMFFWFLVFHLLLVLLWSMWLDVWYTVFHAVLVFFLKCIFWSEYGLFTVIANIINLYTQFVMSFVSVSCPFHNSCTCLVTLKPCFVECRRPQYGIGNFTFVPTF